MDKRGKINWSEFFKIFIGLAAASGGAMLVVTSQGRPIPIVGGIILAAGGFALLFIEK